MPSGEYCKTFQAFQRISIFSVLQMMLKGKYCNGCSELSWVYQLNYVNYKKSAKFFDMQFGS